MLTLHHVGARDVQTEGHEPHHEALLVRVEVHDGHLAAPSLRRLAGSRITRGVRSHRGAAVTLKRIAVSVSLQRTLVFGFRRRRLRLHVRVRDVYLLRRAPRSLPDGVLVARMGPFRGVRVGPIRGALSHPRLLSLGRVRGPLAQRPLRRRCRSLPKRPWWRRRELGARLGRR